MSGGQARRHRRTPQLPTTVSRVLGGAIDPAATYEISAPVVPLPTILPSYNQIGFDSLHYLLGTAS